MKHAIFMSIVGFASTTVIAQSLPLAVPKSSDLASDTIVVTGSRAKGRTVLNSPVPVDVLTANDISRSGALGGELGQALQNITPSFNFPRQSNSGGGDIVRAAQLRGLSPDQTLVLINGKRRHVTSIVNLETAIGRGTVPVDFNSIASNSIKRIEVLRDGAGAQYGSDAVAGVINIILDDAPTGAEASGSYGFHSTNFDPTGKHITDGQTFVIDGKASVPLFGKGFVRVGAEYRNRKATNRAGIDQGGFFLTGSTTSFDDPANLATIGRVNFRVGDPKSNDLNVWYNSEYALSDSVKFYSFANFNRRNAAGAAFYRYPVSDVNILGLYPNGYRPETTGKNTDYAIDAGLKGEVANWNYDGSLTYGHNSFDYGVKNSLNPSLGTASPTSFQSATFRFSQLTANLDITRNFSGGTGEEPISVSWGAEYRHEKYSTLPGDVASYGAQANPGLQAQDAANLSRDVFAAYADIAHKIGPLGFDIAARYEHYNDFGSSVAGKLSARYELGESFALRGSISNSIRAPGLAQEGFKYSVNDFIATGGTGPVLTLPVSDPSAQALGAEGLKAEKAFNISLGLTGKITDGLTFSVDYFQIRVNDRITLSEQISFKDANGNDLLTQPQIAALGLPNNVFNVRYFTNAANTQTDGVDVVGTYKHALASGTLALTSAFNWSSTKVTKIANPPAQLAALGLNGQLVGDVERGTLEKSSPHTKLILTSEWSNTLYRGLVRGSRYGPVTRYTTFAPPELVGSAWQLDTEIGYSPLKNIDLSIGASNLLDNYPTRSSDNINGAGNFPYDILSPIGVNGRYVYAKVTVKY